MKLKGEKNKRRRERERAEVVGGKREEQNYLRERKERKERELAKERRRSSKEKKEACLERSLRLRSSRSCLGLLGGRILHINR